jgi:hypothetical protein
MECYKETAVFPTVCFKNSFIITRLIMLRTSVSNLFTHYEEFDMITSEQNTSLSADINVTR